MTIAASALAGTSIPTTRAGTRPAVGGAASRSTISSSGTDARLASQKAAWAKDAGSMANTFTCSRRARSTEARL